MMIKKIYAVATLIVMSAGISAAPSQEIANDFNDHVFFCKKSKAFKQALLHNNLNQAQQILTALKKHTKKGSGRAYEVRLWTQLYTAAVARSAAVKNTESFLAASVMNTQPVEDVQEVQEAEQEVSAKHAAQQDQYDACCDDAQTQAWDIIVLPCDVV